MKRVFGTAEVVFDVLYLAAAFIIGFILILSESAGSFRALAGVMAFILAGGDAFHLVPRIAAVVTGGEERLRRALGLGKQITSITMSVFYIALWHLGLRVFSLNVGIGSHIVWALSAVRIVLCLLPQNKWDERYPPLSWAILRNAPFILLGCAAASLFFVHRNEKAGFEFMWLAIALSFAFYIPVTLFSNKNAKIGMLMLPKTCAYVWMLTMFLSL